MDNLNYNAMPDLISDEIIARVSKLSPALLCDGMKNLGILGDGAMDASLLPIDGSKVMIGTAYTVDTEEGDNFPIHVAIYQGKPGYVLVVSGKGYQEKAYVGDLMAGAADAIGLKGLVIDGCVRDEEGLKKLDIPVYSKGLMQRGPGKKRPGKINTIINCAGIQVSPGDLIFGDCDGVTVIPRDRILEVLEKAEEKDRYESDRKELINNYRTLKAEGKELPSLAPKWVKEMMEDMTL